jgi:hypothetical protein
MGDSELAESGVWSKKEREEERSVTNDESEKEKSDFLQFEESASFSARILDSPWHSCHDTPSSPAVSKKKKNEYAERVVSAQRQKEKKQKKKERNEKKFWRAGKRKLKPYPVVEALKVAEPFVALQPSFFVWAIEAHALCVLKLILFFDGTQNFRNGLRSVQRTIFHFKGISRRELDFHHHRGGQSSK